MVSVELTTRRVCSSAREAHHNELTIAGVVAVQTMDIAPSKCDEPAGIKPFGLIVSTS